MRLNRTNIEARRAAEEEQRQITAQRDELRGQEAGLRERWDRLERDQTALEKQQAKVQAEERRSMALTATPSYWRMQQATGFSHELVPVPDAVKAAIQTLMNHTCDGHLIGQGRDGNRMTHSRLKVDRVFCLEDAKMWRQ